MSHELEARGTAGDGRASARRRRGLLRLGTAVAIVASTAVAAPSGVTAATAVMAQDASRIDSGWTHTCALTETGRAKCWGRNRNFQLGDGTRTSRFVPRRVSNLEPNVASIAAGFWHTCALMETGGAKCWGYNNQGQLGDGTSTARSTPVDVVGLHRDAVAIAAGYSQTCALMNTGGVKCWGTTGFGRFLTPVDVPQLTGVVAISAGWNHTCALTDAGGVRCWGANDEGQLGDGTTSRRNAPVDVVGLTGGVAAISAGRGYTCAVTDGGGAKCWGGNDAGRLGDRSTAERRLTPVDVSGLTSGVVAVAAGVQHTCAITEAHGAMCWGRNYWGQLGNGTTVNRRTPVTVSGTARGMAAISLGYEHSCALTDAGGVRCWGSNLSGQLGDGSTRERATPVDVSDLKDGVAAISAGKSFTCAVTKAGGAKCWGRNGWSDRLLGNGTRSNRSVPVDVSGLTSGVVAISSSYDSTCAVLDWGRVKCWGSNSWGQLGNGTRETPRTAVRVVGLDDVVGIAAGGDHSCALTDLGGVKCWGDNRYGQLGDGTTQRRLTPVDVSGLTGGVAAISAAYGYTCALMKAGGVKCWGLNYTGQLGDGTSEDRSTPVDVPGLGEGATTISTGEFHACATTETGAATCWGTGALGDGTIHSYATPISIPGLSKVVAIAAGSGYTCAIVGSGMATCWGRNSSGQLGDGTTEDRLEPVPVSGLTNDVAAISAGSEHTCAITDAGSAKCWGDNLYGEVGDGAPTWEPVDVVGFP